MSIQGSRLARKRGMIERALLNEELIGKAVHSQLSPTARLLYVSMVLRADHRGMTWINGEQLVRDLGDPPPPKRRGASPGASVNSTYSWIAGLLLELSTAGLIRLSHIADASTYYVLPEIAAAAEIGLFSDSIAAPIRVVPSALGVPATPDQLRKMRESAQ